MKLTSVDCKYGAPMGRHGKGLTNAGPVKMHLQKIPLDSGGYDSGGAYWGLRPREAFTRSDGYIVKMTKTLYWFWWNGNKPGAAKPILIEGFIDAFTREDAKAQIREEYPEATFYR